VSGTRTGGHRSTHAAQCVSVLYRRRSEILERNLKVVGERHHLRYREVLHPAGFPVLDGRLAQVELAIDLAPSDRASIQALPGLA
jgi:hypothetical protein